MMKVPDQPITKANFLAILTERQKQEAIKHFRGIYPEADWNQREQDLTYLAWLVGEAYLVLSDHWMEHYDDKVEFDADDYAKRYPNDTCQFYSLDYTCTAYELKQLYEQVLKK